jgi:mycothiol system anti-sigma-R factor
MSCGNHHETPCSDVLAEVWLFLDQECDPSRRQKLEQHLGECSPCLEEYGIDEHLKELLARKCGGDHASAEFKQRLRTSIREVVLEHTSEAALELKTARIERTELRIEEV